MEIFQVLDNRAECLAHNTIGQVYTGVKLHCFNGASILGVVLSADL